MPGTDGALAWGLARLLIDAGSYDREFVEHFSTGFGPFRDYARTFELARVAEQTGVAEQRIRQAAQMMVRARPHVVIAPGIALEHQAGGVNTLRTLCCLSGLCGQAWIRRAAACGPSPRRCRI